MRRNKLCIINSWFL